VYAGAPVIQLTKSQAKLLGHMVERFRQTFEAEVVKVLEAQFVGVVPADVRELLEQLSLLALSLKVKRNPVGVHDIHGRLLKRILINERRHEAESIDTPIRKAIDTRLIRELRGKLRPIEALMEEPWFAELKAAHTPQLTDYLSVRHAEAGVPDKLEQLPREYDEKFHILEAPALFLPDLAYYRIRCGLRGVPIAVAYMDIDDFKTFNTAYGETKVDIDLLTPFMEAVEAHVFGHGHAYRFGGDEYVLQLPNCDHSWAVRWLTALQERLAKAKYKGIEGAPSVSIGVCIVDPDCILTDREVLERANKAKDQAKKRKGAIALYQGQLYHDEDIELVVPPAVSEAPSHPPSTHQEPGSDLG